MNFFIADLHFGDGNILVLDRRPFCLIKDHDQYIINKWNNAVGKDDDVYVLGDISWHDPMETLKIFSKLNGHIHLIKGDHDLKTLKTPELCARFTEIVDYKELEIEKDKKIVLSHYPIPCFNGHRCGCIHFYGHVHNGIEWNFMESIKMLMNHTYQIPCEMYNVGAMLPYMDYTPRTMEEIVQGDKERRMRYFK